jgi:hypothetical protein
MDSNGLATPTLPFEGTTPTGTQPSAESSGPSGAEPSAPALNLRQKLAQVRREVGYIQKRGKNDYSYAMAADIAGAIGDRLAALNVVLGRRNLSVKRDANQCGQGSETVVEVTLDYEFIDGDSDEILSVPSYGEGRDSGDKAPYKALTGALKYALIQTFLIATGDDPEEERSDHQAMSTNARRYKRSISAEQAQTLSDLIEQTGTDQAKVLEFYAVSKLEEMTADNYRKALRLLRLKLSKRSGGNGAGRHSQQSNASL